jgi:colicin import membrane protein
VSAMNPSANHGSPYQVPPEPSRWSSIALAAVVHLGLLLFLWIGVSWQNNDNVSVDAEVWDMNTQADSAPEPVQPEPVIAPAPQPEPEPVVAKVEPEPEQFVKAIEEPAQPKAPDIALEKAKIKLKQLQEKKLAEEEAERDKAQELLKKKNKEIAEATNKARLNKLRAAAMEELELREQREAALANMAGKVTKGSDPSSTSNAADKSYIASIRAKVDNKFRYQGDTDADGNAQVVFIARQLGTGEIIPGSLRMTKSSGVPGFDEAVKNAIEEASPLPKRKDGTVSPTIELTFKMKDLRQGR